MRGSGFLLGVLCSGLDLNKKFRQYCKVRWENNTAELTTADPRAIEEFYPEFPELYDYFFSLGVVKEPAHPINEGYLNVSKILSLKKDLEESVMPFGFISGGSVSKKFMEIVNIIESSVVTNFYTKNYLKIYFRKAWKEVGVNRSEFWEGDLFYMSGGKICLVLDLDSDRYIAVSSHD